MPKIPDSAKSKGSGFLKPDSFEPKLNYGEKVEFTITAPHVETKQRDGNVSFSIPVSANEGKTKGSFSINKTNMKILSDVLGDDSDVWSGSKYTAMVSVKRNPQTGGNVKGWDIIAETIVRPRKVGVK